MRRTVTALMAVGLFAGVLLPLGGLSAAAVEPAASDNAANDPPLPLPEPNVVPLHVTGPAEDRMNLILLGDGYQWDQQSIFHEDIDRNLAVMFATEPYKSYRDYLNIYAVELASIDYGVRCDPDGRQRHEDGTIRSADPEVREGPINTKNTALRMIYQNGCNDPLSRGTVYGGAPVNCAAYEEYYPEGVNPCETGAQARNRILNDYVAPVVGIPANAQNLQTLVIFNTFTYGGIGGTHATTSGGSPQGPIVSLHELGHSHGTMADEYPYSSRDVLRPCYDRGEPGSFHHTIMTSEEQMIANQHKWWRWIGEESISGGRVSLWEGGNTYPCGIRRPSNHSIMRWVGFHWDQPGLEHMVGRITGRRNAGQMALPSTPQGTVGIDEVLWVRPSQPRSHSLQTTWRIGGPSGQILDTDNNPYLDLGDLDVDPGTVIHVEVRDPVGPDGRDWVRNPSTNNTASDSGYNGPRYVQTRQWTVGTDTVAVAAPGASITNHTDTDTPVAGSDTVFVETNQPLDRVIDITWRIDGQVVSSPGNARTIDLSALDLASGTYELTATAVDPAGGSTDTVSWSVDNVMPSAPRELSEPLTTIEGDLEHGIYFGGWDMWLDPQDDLEAYDGEERFVVGEFRLNGDGWFNYFGFPEEPMPDSPFEFRHSGQDVKALTYGNLGSGGLSKATFEQYLDGHPSGTFEPGYGTHMVEHRAIDPAGNISEPESYRATALPGEQQECTRTIDGNHRGGLTVVSGVTCIAGDARVSGGVNVRPGASLVVEDGATIVGGLTSTRARVVHLFGARVNGRTEITGTSNDLIIAGSQFAGGLELHDNDGYVTTILSGATREYGVLLIGNEVNGRLVCSGNSPMVNNFDVPNTARGMRTGDCATL